MIRNDQRNRGDAADGEDLPLRQREGASLPVALAADEVTLEAESVVDVGVD